MRARPLAERFWEKVERRGAGECWLWTAFRTPKGYGMIGLGRRMIHAHRAAWMIEHSAEVPKGMVVCHACDNPGCVNPAHLFIGTQQDNIADMVAKGRQRGDYRPGELCPTAKLTKAQAKCIKQRLASGETQRALALEYGVSQPTISDLARGKTWGSV